MTKPPHTNCRIDPYAVGSGSGWAGPLRTSPTMPITVIQGELGSGPMRIRAPKALP